MAGGHRSASLGPCAGRLDHLDFGHEQQVENAELLILLIDDDRPPGRRHREKVGVRDVEGAPVGHVDGEGTVRGRVLSGAELLNRHQVGSGAADGLVPSVSEFYHLEFAWTSDPAAKTRCDPDPLPSLL